MQITLGIDFDHGYWPGPLVDRQATAGEAWVGPLGFLSILEASCGLGTPHESAALRAARLVPRVLESEGFWSASAEHNPLAAAQTLLRWRDRLWMQGWRGEPLVPRLEQLALVTADAGPGLADRLAALGGLRGQAFGDLASVGLRDPRDNWAPAWKTLFATLEATGVQVRESDAREVTAEGDLGRAQQALAGGAGDGSLELDGTLQLLRPYGPVRAAEEVAAWLGTLPDLDGIVVIGGDPALDRALRAHGLPTTGAASTRAPGALLQVLPLALALGWDPADPQRALELLTLPVGPVPGGIRWRLHNALEEWPAVESPRWAEELLAGLAEIEDESQRKRVEERLEALLEPRVRRGQLYPTSEVARRTRVVQRWLKGREIKDEVAGNAWGAALAQCRSLLALFEASGLAELSAAQLDRFANQATDSANERASFEAQAGLTSLARPGSIVGPARRVIWWGFDLASATGTPGWFLSPAAAQKLTEVGIEVPDLGHEAMATAERWRRPLRFAQESVLLVCPRTGEGGGDLYPHPLWDEITGRLGEAATSSLTVGRPAFFQEPSRVRLPHIELPTPRREWTVAPESIGHREKESLSGLSRFLGCSLNWAMNYHAGLRPGRSTQANSEAALEGKLLHEVVERVLIEAPPSPEAARKRAIALFDELGPKLAAPFYLPGADALRSHARRMAGDGARRLAEILATDGRRVVSVEASHYREALGAEIGGRLDLVVGDPPAIIDLKRGSAKYRRDDLKLGTAGLAVYSFAMQEEGEPFPPHGYFIFTDQVLLSTDQDYFPQAEPVDGPGAEETWKAWKKAWAEQRRKVSQGRLEAPGNPDDAGDLHPESDAVDDGRVVLKPPCHFCDFQLLCGRFFDKDER